MKFWEWEYLVREASASELNRYQEWLCELGRDRWELVTCNTLPTNDLKCRLVFKRPIESTVERIFGDRK
jgi:hypothetical protein